MLIGTTYYYERGPHGGRATDMDLDVPEPGGPVPCYTLRMWRCMNGERRISMTLGDRVRRIAGEKGIQVTDTWDCFLLLLDNVMRAG